MDDIAPDILEKAASGDMEAFERIYKTASGFVYNVALRITRNGADAQEVAQDVFMNVYRHLKDFEFRSSFKTWVYRITVNTALNKYRATAKDTRREAVYDDSVESVACGGTAADAAIRGECEDRIAALLDCLSPEHKACLILREIEGLSYEEIADALDIPINTVRSRLKRGREALMEAAGKERVRDAV